MIHRIMCAALFAVFCWLKILQCLDLKLKLKFKHEAIYIAEQHLYLAQYNIINKAADVKHCRFYQELLTNQR